jgi:hypothetical protein
MSDVAYLVLFVVVWVVLQRFLLPKLGVPT